MIGQFVVVRTRSAGVHVGYLVESHGTAVTLRDALRLWAWKGAFSLNEVATEGVAESSRISVVVPLILLTEAIEVIPCSEKARLSLNRPRNGA